MVPLSTRPSTQRMSHTHINWCPPGSPSPEKVSTDPCPLGTCTQTQSVSLHHVIFQTAASVLGLGASQVLHACFKSRVLVSYIPLTHLEVRPSGFQSQILWDSSSQCKSPELGSPIWDSEPLVFRENLQGCDIPPTDGLQHCKYESWPDHVSVPPGHLSVAFPFCLQLWKNFSVSIHVILRHSFSI